MKRDKNRTPVQMTGDAVMEDLSRQFRDIGEESDSTLKKLEKAERNGHWDDAEKLTRILRCLEVQADEVRYRMTRRSIRQGQNLGIVRQEGVHRGGQSLPKNNIPRRRTGT